MKKLKFLGILLIGLLLLASPANATGYRMIMMAGGVEAADGGNDAYTKLLMHMEGTDDAQVFTDSSVGNLVKVDPGTGFSDAFGVFDGTNDYLSCADHADWNFGTDPFTIEMWVYHRGDSGEGLVARREDGDNFWNWHLMPDGDSYFEQQGQGGTLNLSFTTTNYKVQPYTWTHVALVRSGSDWEVYHGGLLAGGATSALAIDTLTGDLWIGVTYNPAYVLGHLNGYMAELRISDSARYSTTFTPQTANHSNDGNTLLLLHMDLPNTDPQSFVDSGNTGHTVTDNGGVYQKARNLGIIGTSCGYFDGTGDYLSIPDSVDWTLGTGAFTIEAWVIFNSLASVPLIYQVEDGNTFVGVDYTIAGNKLQFRSYDTSLDISFSTPWTPNLGVWYHIAVVRVSNTDIDSHDIFIDGVAQTLTLDGGAWNATIHDATGPLKISGDPTAFGSYLDCYLQDLRIVKGTAVYTANFNPPTTALTAITNTKLLLHFDGGEGSVSFDDDSASDHTVTANGNAIQVIGHGADAVADVKTENTQFKFGSTAAYFDGTGDYIIFSDSSDWDIFASADSMTVDFWVKHDDHEGEETYVTHATDGTHYWSLMHLHGTGLRFISYDGAIVVIFTGAEITDTNWHHVALVKNSTRYDLYLDGTTGGNSTDADVATYSGDLLIGVTVSAGAPFAGYIDELRISKGIARWTANFTPPNAAYYE